MGPATDLGRDEARHVAWLLNALRHTHRCGAASTILFAYVVATLLGRMACYAVDVGLEQHLLSILRADWSLAGVGRQEHTLDSKSLRLSRLCVLLCFAYCGYCSSLCSSAALAQSDGGEGTHLIMA